MFEKAAHDHFYWNCSVGGCNKSVVGARIVGAGCVLDGQHTLTALHCWSSISRKFSHPMVSRMDGTFVCEVVFKSTTHDIAVLRTIKELSPEPKGGYRSFPIISAKSFWLGKSVGFVSTLRLQTLDKYKSITQFGQAAVSGRVPKEPNKAERYFLTSTIVQPGFSGSAVFDCYGDILAIFTERLRFKAELQDPNANVYNLASVSPVFPVRKQIIKLLSKTKTPD